MVISTILGYVFRAGSSCFHHMQVYRGPFSVNTPVKIKGRLFQSINKSPNTSFALSTGLVNNPIISPQLYNYMLDRYTIRNFRVAILITKLKRIPCFRNYSVADNDAKYESTKTILFVLAHLRTISFSTFVP